MSPFEQRLYKLPGTTSRAPSTRSSGRCKTRQMPWSGGEVSLTSEPRTPRTPPDWRPGFVTRGHVMDQGVASRSGEDALVRPRSHG